MWHVNVQEQFIGKRILQKLMCRFKCNNLPESCDVFIKLENINTHNTRQRNNLEYIISR